MKIHANTAHFHTCTQFAMAFVCPFEGTAFILILFSLPCVRARAHSCVYMSGVCVCVCFIIIAMMLFSVIPCCGISAKYWPYTNFAHGFSFHASIFGFSDNETLFYIRNMNWQLAHTRTHTCTKKCRENELVCHIIIRSFLYWNVFCLFRKCTWKYRRDENKIRKKWARECMKRPRHRKKKRCWREKSRTYIVDENFNMKSNCRRLYAIGMCAIEFDVYMFPITFFFAFFFSTTNWFFWNVNWAIFFYDTIIHSVGTSLRNPMKNKELLQRDNEQKMRSCARRRGREKQANKNSSSSSNLESN